VKLRWDESTKHVPSWDTADGLEIYFSDLQPGGYGNSDIWVMTRETTDEDWGPPLNLGSTVNSTADEATPAISADGLQLYFGGGDAQDRPGGYGRSDLWMTKRATRDEPWEEPVNLGPKVNTASWDGRPTISQDGLLLFFDSNRAGGFGSVDMYVTRRASLSEAWEEPVNLGPVVNSSAFDAYAHMSADGSTLYFDSMRPGGYGERDIWEARIIAWNGQVELNDEMTSTKEQTKSSSRKEVTPEENH
jgi:Tol biopolymer transport system component